MERISSNIRESAKVSILGSVVSKNIALLRIATGNNRWIICPDLQPEKKIEVSAGSMKFVDFPTTSAGTNQNTRDEEGMDGSETDISSNTDSDSDEDREATNVRNVDNIRWSNSFDFLYFHCNFYFSQITESKYNSEIKTSL
ncbi:hypothetical protein Glove_47g15 [Diversispora epigaea]|uniref:Uncharacterized protein n=1 Tax=Diversispora epigaea TaxID=1348612 RepID=A0A397JGH6_9GLOM|nr:hypothetical protein Glove_47g15 [Diversispora epigaea]